MSLKKTIVLKYTLDCNLRCKYCYEFGRDEHEDLNKCKMTAEKICEIIERSARLFTKSKILWMLHGGEPLIYGINYVERIFRKIEEVNSNYDVEYKLALQTNGILINENWIELFDRYGYLLSERNISISIDGDKSINDETRVDINGNGTFDKLYKNIELLRKSNLDITTISVIGSHNVERVDEVYQSIKTLKPNFAKFIPCYNFDKDGNVENFGITPIQYSEFICRLFDIWIKDLPSQNDDFLVIDPITTIISKITDSFVTWCEFSKKKCDNFLSIFPSGDMWLCDSFQQSLHKDYGFLGNYDDLNDEEFKERLAKCNNVCNFEQFFNKSVQKCSNCEIEDICNGGCLPYRDLLESKSEKLFNDYCKSKHQIIRYIEEGIKNAMA